MDFHFIAHKWQTKKRPFIERLYGHLEQLKYDLLGGETSRLVECKILRCVNTFGTFLAKFSLQTLLLEINDT